MTEIEIKAIRDGVLNGLNISFHRLIKEKQKNNASLVFQENRKITKIQASDL